MGNLIEKIESGDFALIAEIGVNYYDIARKEEILPMEAAKLMCREAKEAGVDAVKFQTYKAEALAARESPSYWDTSEETTTSQYSLFKKYDSFGEQEYQELADYCRLIGVDFCSTAFDFDAARYLNPLMKVFKVSSSDLTNLPFIEYQASFGKPIILSVGAGDLREIREAVEVVRRVNSAPLSLLHCVLEYPTPYDHANLRRIRSLAEEFPFVTIGYSDHCRPDSNVDVIKTAYTLGARIVEKHFTLDKSLAGNDHYHAMDPDDVVRMKEGVAWIESLLGEAELVHSETENVARLNARRSIVAAVDIGAGTTIENSHLTFKRPGTGISPSDLRTVVGRRAVVNICEDTLIEPEMLC